MTNAMIKDGGADAGDRLTCVVADLERDRGWADATADCDYVLHIASPFPLKVPKHEDGLIVPMR
jgi:dihydroflavonol-4-reductase